LIKEVCKTETIPKNYNLLVKELSLKGLLAFCKKELNLNKKPPQITLNYDKKVLLNENNEDIDLIKQDNLDIEIEKISREEAESNMDFLGFFIKLIKIKIKN
jgi:hypothetical protein